MKPLKYVLSLLLTLLFALPLSAPALALENESLEEQESVPAAVCTLDELLTAIESAEDGDTIAICKTIIVESDCNIGVPNKHITLIRGTDFSDCIIRVCGGIVNITKIDFDGLNDESVAPALILANTSFILEKCGFYNNATGAVSINADCAESSIVGCDFIHNYTPLSSTYIRNLIVKDSCFLENNGLSTCIEVSGNVAFSGCIFEGNCTSGMDAGVILYMSDFGGSCNFEDSSFNKNTTTGGRGAAILSGGKTVISKCTFVENSSDVAGNDLAVFGDGHFSILDTNEEMERLYELIGLQYEGIFIDEIDSRYKEGDSPLELPLIDCITDVAFGFHEKPETPPVANTGDDDDSIPSRPNNTLGNAGENENTGNKGELNQTFPTTELTTTEPQIIYVPVYIEIPKILDTTNPSNGSESIEQAQPIRSLSVNGIRLVERTEYLDGCGDILSISEIVTRAATAQLLYGLVDDGELVNTAYYAYADVPPDSYCAPAISTLSNAGIFCGYNGSFAPDAPLTQGGAVTILARLKGIEKGTDVYEHWAEPFLLAIQKHGIAENVTIASLDKPITPGMLLEMIAALFSSEI